MDKGEGGRRILVVEDDVVLRDMVVKGLQKSGYDVLSAETGEQALALLREWGGRIDWLFVDIRLPGVIDGWVVGSEFTLNHPLRPVIYASAYAPDFSRQVAGSVFMRKPVRVKEIVATFQELTARFATQMSPRAISA
ncbi:MAG TPA: response regulator [Beijerinckiaceae bacterium]|jgi:CheY-like chemotaxis protein|nr:response regulator [Beijerinckiaceae bacterium]